MTIMPIVVGALAFGLVMVFSLQSGVGSRISDAGDAQMTSSTFLKDVQSAQMITEMPGIACGTGLAYASPPLQLLGLEWAGTGGTYLVTVSYLTEQNPGLSSYSLIRQECTQGDIATPTDVTTVATDLSASGANALPYIECASNPVDSNCSPSYYDSNWMSAGDVQYVLLSAQEHALLPAPNQSTPFTLTLAAAPRLHLEASLPSGGGGSAPITVLGTSCATPPFTITNNVTVSINVQGGTGNGSLGLSANCPAVEVDNGGVLNAKAILTENPNLNSVYESPSGTTYPIPEYYAKDIGDPYANLTPPDTSANGLTPGTCRFATGAWTCTAGYYAQDPGTQYHFGTGQTVDFTTNNCQAGPGPCRFLFENGLNLPSAVNVNFATGVYVFWDNSGDFSACGTPNPEGSALSGQPNDTINGTSGVLFYVACGSVDFQPGITINMKGLGQYLGVAIWDADKQNPMVIGNNSSGGGAYAGYGGIYVPKQGIQVNNDAGGVLTVSFMVAESLTFKQNLTINITSP